jgi:hypothetical protein
VPDEFESGLEAVHQADDAGRDAVLGGRGPQDLGDQFGQGRVVGVGLDDDRAARGQRARGVAARDGEGEGEVGGGVDGDDAERDLVAAQVRDGRGRGRVGVVDDDVEEGALLDDAGEGAQLVAGAGEFAVEPDRAERGLRVGDLDELVLRGLQVVGGGAQEGGADRAVGERLARGVGGRDGGVHLLGCGLHRNLFPLLPGSGVDTPDWCCCHRGSLPVCRRPRRRSIY